MLWEERYWKGTYKVRFLIKGRKNALAQALEHIPQHSKFREIQKGECFVTLIRLLHRKKRQKQP
jgi:hypothetical protein